MSEITRDDKIKALKREIALRINVYKGRIASGKMKLKDAEREVDIMRAILRDYESSPA